MQITLDNVIFVFLVLSLLAAFVCLMLSGTYESVSRHEKDEQKAIEQAQKKLKPYDLTAKVLFAITFLLILIRCILKSPF